MNERDPIIPLPPPRRLDVFVSLDNLGREEENRSPCEVPRR